MQSKPSHYEQQLREERVGLQFRGVFCIFIHSLNSVLLKMQNRASFQSNNDFLTFRSIIIKIESLLTGWCDVTFRLGFVFTACHGCWEIGSNIFKISTLSARDDPSRQNGAYKNFTVRLLTVEYITFMP